MLTEQLKQGKKQRLLHKDVYYQITSWTYLEIYKDLLTWMCDLPKRPAMLRIALLNFV